MHRRDSRKVSVIAIVFLCLFSFSTVGCAPTPSPTKTASANLKRLKQQVDTVKATEKVQKTQVAARHLGAGKSEPIYHEKTYPAGSGPFPAVIALHSSGGFKSVKHLIQRYVDDGFAVYAPDFFKRHGLTPRTRFKTFSTYRENIEEELTEIVDLVKNDPKINKKNVFAVGYSNGGFWVGYLTGKAMVNAGVAHYGVWKGNMGREITNPYPMKYFSKSSTPILALHGEDDGTQKMRFVRQAWDEVKDRGGRLETHVYSGADHAWVGKTKKWPYNEEVDKDSHKRTIGFFKKHMK